MKEKRSPFEVSFKLSEIKDRLGRNGLRELDEGEWLWRAVRDD